MFDFLWNTDETELYTTTTLSTSWLTFLLYY